MTRPAQRLIPSLPGLEAEPRRGERVAPGADQLAAPPARSWGARVHERLLDVYGFAVLLALWELAPRLGWLNPMFFPPLSVIAATGVHMIANGELPRHVLASLGRTFLGLGVAAALAVPLGLYLGGRSPRLARFLGPLFNLFAQVNAFALFPVFVLFFGIGEVAKFAIIFWACLWPLLLGTIGAVASVDSALVKTARSMGVGGVELVREVLLPAALPVILAAARVGALTAFVMLVAAEMAGASTGLGWVVLNAMHYTAFDRLFLATVVIAALGALLQHGLLRLERRLVFWAHA